LKEEKKAKESEMGIENKKKQKPSVREEKKRCTRNGKPGTLERKRNAEIGRKFGEWYRPGRSSALTEEGEAVSQCRGIKKKTGWSCSSSRKRDLVIFRAGRGCW